MQKESPRGLFLHFQAPGVAMSAVRVQVGFQQMIRVWKPRHPSTTNGFFPLGNADALNFPTKVAG
jgi:hypothetical protein